MNEFEKKFSAAPKDANRFATEQDPKKMFADVTGENADGDVRPVRLVAFTGKPMNHWWYGPCVFDRSGFEASSEQITIDFDHNPSEELGFLDKFTGDPELICEGVLLPFGNDRAAQVIHRAKRGRKYQCSVTVDEYLRTEYLEDGTSAEVNGQIVQGPITIFREYKIMGVAITPYATDKGTDTEIFNHKEPNDMSVTDNKPKEPTKNESNGRELFKKFQKLFGDVRAAKYFSDGLDEEQAKEQYIDDVKDEIVELETKVEDLEAEVAKKDEKIAELETQLSDGNADGSEDKKDDAEKEYAAKISALESELAQLKNAAGIFKAEPAPVSGNHQTGDKPKQFSPFSPEADAYAERIQADIDRSKRNKKE